MQTNMKIYKAGFSFIETIIYVAILSLVIVGAVSISLIVKQSQLKFEVHRRVASDVSTFINNVDFLVRNSDGFATDNTGKACEDFHGAQGYNSYYLTLYYGATTANTILPYECSGDWTATTTAIKIYWNGTSTRGLYIDCFRGFNQGAASNCTLLAGYGDATFLMSSEKGTRVYDGGLVFATSTAYGYPALSTTITMGVPNHGGPSYLSATTTASSTSAFRVKISDAPAPTEQVCGDGSRQGTEVCDSTITTACALDSTYYKGGYVEDGSTCSGKAACNKSCSACLSTASCDGSSCGGYSSGGKCWYLGAAGQTCNTVCTGHGSCVSGNSFDDASCTVLTALGADCTSGCNIGSNFYNPHWDGATPGQCAYSSTLTERCTASVAGARRLCACTS